METKQQQMAESAGAQKQMVLGLATVFLTYFIYMFFIQILLSALPKIAADLDGMQLYSWGVSIPNLGLAFSMLMVGKLSDLYGRRPLLLVCLAVCLVGTIWSALSSTFVMLIIARTFLSIGQGGLAPLCFSVLGDMFEPVQRSKWVGLLNIPAGVFAMIGPTLGGWFVDNLSWRYIFWCAVPLLIACLVLVSFGLSGRTQHAAPKIDTRGALLAAVASSTMILAFSMAGTMYPWSSIQVIGLLAISIIFGALFVKAEAVAEEPLLDLQVLKNRSFATIASACLFSCFGMVGLMIYYPLLMQGVQGISATSTGQIMTPGNVLMIFLGVLAGFILARTKRYKWMFVLGYGITLAIMLYFDFLWRGNPYLGVICGIHSGRHGHGSYSDLEYPCCSICRAQKAFGRGDGCIVFQRHDRAGDRTCDPGLCHEHEIQQYPESRTPGGSVPIGRQSHNDFSRQSPRASVGVGNGFASGDSW